MSTRISRKPTTEGPVNIGMILLKRVEALAYWVKRQTTCGEPLDSNAFTPEVLEQTQSEMSAADSRKDAKDEIASKSDPGKLQMDNFKRVNWKKKMVNHLYNIRGTRAVRLIYIVRDLLLNPLPAGHQLINKDERMIWTATHVGPEFQVDNTNLYQIVQRCCIGTDGATWIHQASTAKDGYAALNALCQQFDGRNMKQKRKMYAEQQLRNLHYRNKKTSMKFDRFAAYLKDAFDIMEDCSVVYPEEHKITTLFEKVRGCTYFDFQSRITILKTNPTGAALTFDNVVSQLSEAITSSVAADPTHHQQQQRNDRRDIYSVAQQRGGRGCRRDNRGGRGSNQSRGTQSGRRRTIVNGIDCTDLTRWCSNEEFSKLPPNIQNSIKEAKAQRKRSTTSQASTASRPPSSGNAASVQQRIITSIQTILADQGDDVSALPNDSEATTTEPADDAATSNPGDAFGRHAYAQNSKRRKQGQVRILRRLIAFTTAVKPHRLPPPQEAYCKLDRRADTCCFGANFLSLEFTGQSCEVAPFLPEFGSTQDIPVCTPATTFVHPDTHEPIVIVINEGLLFGDCLPHSLINPNQCRHYGISLCDDPFDQHRPFGLKDPDSQIFLPFHLPGTITTFGPTHTPTDDELRHCRRITLTSALPWHPSNVNLLHGSQEEEEYQRMAASVNQLSDTNQTETDLCLSSVSTALCPRTFANRIIAQVRVHNKHRDAASLFSDQRHSEITPETLSRK